jgi:hypothetical protein
MLRRYQGRYEVTPTRRSISNQQEWHKVDPKFYAWLPDQKVYGSEEKSLDEEIERVDPNAR